MLRCPRTQVLLGYDQEFDPDPPHPLMGSHRDHPTNVHPVLLMHEEPWIHVAIETFQMMGSDPSFSYTELESMSSWEREMWMVLLDVQRHQQAEVEAAKQQSERNT